jgi:hypothetical protein
MVHRRKASEVYRDILGGKAQRWTSIFSELYEFLEAISCFNFKEANLEGQQVLYAIQMQYYQMSGVDFYLQFCDEVVDGFYLRREVWLEIFKEYNVPFKNEYLEYGSNYKRIHKIKKALELAGLKITTKEAINTYLKHLDK